MKLLIVAQVSLFTSFFSFTCQAAPVAGKLYDTYNSQSPSKGQIVFQVSPKINNQEYITLLWSAEKDISPYQNIPKYSDSYRSWTGGLDTDGSCLEGSVQLPPMSSSSTIRAIQQNNVKGVYDSQIRCQLFNGGTSVGRTFSFGEQINLPTTANKITCRAFELSSSYNAQQTPVENEDNMGYNRIEDLTNNERPVDLTPTDPYNDPYNDQYSYPPSPEKPLSSDRKTSSVEFNPKNGNSYDVYPFRVSNEDVFETPDDNSYDGSTENPYENPYDNSYDGSTGNSYDGSTSNSYDNPTENIYDNPTVNTYDDSYDNSFDNSMDFNSEY